MASTPSPPDRVQVWASQLAANDFPPICAMTGAPAEAWQKFNFVTAPRWAYASLVLLITGIGLLPVFIIMAAVSRRAGGHLPLTLASRKKVTRAKWISIDLFVLAILLWIAAAVIASIWTDSSIASTIVGFSVLLGLLSVLAGAAGWVIVRPRFGPSGRVLSRPPGYSEYLVELKKVHPAFIAAVNQMYQARAAQYAAIQAPAYVPPGPGSL